MSMRRLTISVDEALANQFDHFVAEKGYLNRSEAFRDLVRKELGHKEVDSGSAQWCVATISYIYNHHERQLANRITQLQHHHHDIAVAAQHIHLDHDNCLETLILKGETQHVRECADIILSQTGVRHGSIHIVPMTRVESTHTHMHPLIR